MRILITGAGGLLGGRLCRLLAGRHDVTGVIRVQAAPDGVKARQADLCEENSVGELLRNVQPQAIIHCAALADPEICEREPRRAERENDTATKRLARACREAGVRLIAISTDLVFDGRAAFSTENCAVNPISEYGRSKRRAEEAALGEGPRDGTAIARVALVIGPGHGAKRSASEGIAESLSRRERASLYRDEWRTPIDAASVAEAMDALLRRPAATGIFHIAGAERVSRLELGQRIALTLGLDASLIRPAERAQHKGAPRAEDVSLDIGRAKRELGWTPRLLEEALGQGRLT